VAGRPPSATAAGRVCHLLSPASSRRTCQGRRLRLAIDLQARAVSVACLRQSWSPQVKPHSGAGDLAILWHNQGGDELPVDPRLSQRVVEQFTFRVGELRMAPG
jgi:hypothetical protein